MSINKVIFYALLVSTVMLFVVLSMVDMNNPVERLIAKWAVAGLMIVALLSLVIINAIFFKPIRTIPTLVLHAVLIPGLLTVGLGLLLAFFGMDELFGYLVLSPPFIPFCILYIVSFSVHAYIWMYKRQA